MSQRKRIQGQRRRLSKYIKSQTGTSNPHELLKRESDLQTRINGIQKQIDDLQLSVETVSSPNDAMDDSVVDTRTELELRAQQSSRLDYLYTMRQDLKDTLSINRRIYNALCE